MTPVEARAGADPVRDQKAGWCSMCRSGSHALCASTTCVCPGKPRAHPNRPTAAQEATMPAAAPRREEAATRLAGVPSVVVRWEDPPESKRGRQVDFAPELLKQLEANPGRWARVDSFRSKSGASSRLTAFRKGTYKPPIGGGSRAASRRTPTGSAFYLRFVGPAE